MPILASEALLCETNKNPMTKCCPHCDRSRPLINLIPSPTLSFLDYFAFASKTETVDSLYNHALFILTKSSKSKNQVMHEHKFKDLLRSTCLTSSERRVLDLESEIMRGLGFIPAGGNILSIGFFCFHIAKPLMPILALMPLLCVCEKPV